MRRLAVSSRMATTAIERPREQRNVDDTIH
jgi:hypothetical protein